MCLEEGFLCPRCHINDYVLLEAAPVQLLLASLTACCCCHLPRSGDAGLRILCEGLSNNKSVTALDLPDNDISDEGIKELMLALVHNTSLTQLQLAYNKIGNDGAAALAKVREGGHVAGVLKWPGLVRMVLTLDATIIAVACQTLRITASEKMRWAGGVTRAVECEFIHWSRHFMFTQTLHIDSIRRRWIADILRLASSPCLFVLAAHQPKPEPQEAGPVAQPDRQGRLPSANGGNFIQSVAQPLAAAAR